MSQEPITLASLRDQAKASVETIYAAYAGFSWQDPYAYAHWLAQTFYYVREATRLLAYAASRCTHEEEELHHQLLKGVGEEKGHDVMLVNDLKRLGYELSQFKELPATKAYHQTLYFAIDHSGPAALIGYFLPLEGLAAKKLGAGYEIVSRCHSPQAGSFLKAHCLLDVTHFDEGLKSLEKLTPLQLEAVAEGVATSSQLYIGLVQAVQAAAKHPAGQRSPRAA